MSNNLIDRIFTACISHFREILRLQQKEFQAKREKLSEVYQSLIFAINSYPNESPEDVLRYIEYSPSYSMERFETTLKSLDFQIEDYRDRLNNPRISYDQKNDIELEISNREHAKKKIINIQESYFKAQSNYKSFIESHKSVFYLYAGQDVKNALVRFDVAKHNVFISGYPAGDGSDPLKNDIDIIRRNLISCMRADLGIK
jgi:hypothetical protein